MADVLMKQSARAGTLTDALIEIGAIDDATIARERRRFLSESMDVSAIYHSTRERAPAAI
ncbi:MAG TPA: hypothetical protein DCQ98_18005 [Planctomycetaceae bacterium]|nr:hypothetical protein [Planctomycetaceae bacterium]